MVLMSVREWMAILCFDRFFIRVKRVFVINVCPAEIVKIRNHLLLLTCDGFQPCTSCHEMGAMIGCLNKGCHQKFHHACAQVSGEWSIMLSTCDCYVLTTKYARLGQFSEFVCNGPLLT